MWQGAGGGGVREGVLRMADDTPLPQKTAEEYSAIQCVPLGETFGCWK